MDREFILFNFCLFLGLAPFILFGLSAFKRSKPINFWSGDTILPDQIKDISAYNRANGVMWIVAGLLIGLLGLIPVLLNSNRAGIYFILGMIVILSGMIFTYRKIYKKYKT